MHCAGTRSSSPLSGWNLEPPEPERSSRVAELLNQEWGEEPWNAALNAQLGGEAGAPPEGTRVLVDYTEARASRAALFWSGEGRSAWVRSAEADSWGGEFGTSAESI